MDNNVNSINKRPAAHDFFVNDDVNFKIDEKESAFVVDSDRRIGS